MTRKVVKKIKRKKVDIKYLGIPNICFSVTDKDDKREKKFAKQRMTQGFDGSETWSLYGTITRFTLPRLKCLKEVMNGYPLGMASEEWDSILDKMINAFELINLYNNAELEDAGKHKEIDEGMGLFAKHFLDLWW